MRPVTVGFFSFTEVPDGQHRAYNEWHQLDHLPEQYGIEGVVRGDRWVATPACAAARTTTGDDGELLGRAQYVTLYLMAEPIGPTLQAFADLARELRAADRFFAHRQSHLAAPLRLDATAAAPRVLVRAEVVPLRPATGVHVLVEGADADADLDDLVGVDGVAGAWSFVPDPALAPAGWELPEQRITVAWLDADPVATAGALAAVVEARHPVLSSPYLTVHVGQWDWFDRRD
jgi:hypothetical protein